MRTPRAALLPLLTLVLAACPPALRFGPEGEITDAAYLLRRLDARSGALRSIKAEAKVSLKSEQQSGSAGQFVAARRPASLHLETLNFFGKPVAVLAADAGSFSLFVEETGTFYTGPASAANVGRLLPVAIAPAEAVALLLGDVLRLPGATARLELDREARAYLLTLTRGPVTQRIWAGTEDLRILRADVQGAPGLRVAFGDFQAFGNLVFPMERPGRARGAGGDRGGAALQGRRAQRGARAGPLRARRAARRPPRGAGRPGARGVRDAAGSLTPEPARPRLGRARSGAAPPPRSRRCCRLAV